MGLSGKSSHARSTLQMKAKSVRSCQPQSAWRLGVRVPSIPIYEVTGSYPPTYQACESFPEPVDARRFRLRAGSLAPRFSRPIADAAERLQKRPPAAHPQLR